MRQRLLFISHVLPFPGNSGQQQRVANSLKAARNVFETHFLTYSEPAAAHEIHGGLRSFCDKSVILESPVSGPLSRLANRFRGLAFMLGTGLKHSNYTVGSRQFTSQRFKDNLLPTHYDCVIYEYFHASHSAEFFREHRVPTVLDTHNVLWKAMEQRLAESQLLPGWLKKFQLMRYRQQEERAWARFDGLIAINREEERLIQSYLRPNQQLFYAPMGINLSLWPYAWQPERPVRLAYYGGLGSRHNQVAAHRCYNHVMPAIWEEYPDTEFWIVGSNPPEEIRRLTVDRRVKVTGFVENVQEILKTMSLVLCPWSGTYGFRSRIVEVMALGVPIVATPEAVAGMEMESGRGILLEQSDEALGSRVNELLGSPSRLSEQSKLARAEVERLYSLENTYGRLMVELGEWLQNRRRPHAAAGNGLAL